MLRVFRELVRTLYWQGDCLIDVERATPNRKESRRRAKLKGR